MTDGIKRDGRRGRYIVAAAIAVLLVAGVALIVFGLRSPAGPPQPDSDAAGSSSVAPVPTLESPMTAREKQQSEDGKQAPLHAPAARVVDFGPILPASLPVTLDIPSIGVHSTNIVELGLEADGTMEVPEDASAPGWFTRGPSPGQFGPAVIAGHVDSDQGPAVFYRLGELDRGDRVQVTRADGTIGTFLIDRVEAFDKATFPTHQVYGNTTNRAELRLITCGGTYDEDKGYLGNVVAFSHLVSSS